MKKYTISIKVGNIEAINEISAMEQFDNLITSKALGMECYSIKEELPTISAEEVDNPSQE